MPSISDEGAYGKPIGGGFGVFQSAIGGKTGIWGRGSPCSLVEV